ncbi:PspA/IM30 family protein [Bacillus carboniphilus]|uniref:PspA/IM30 family protein n=1 Tax=Bacillus carboniphilus TaxID=86663 RepID=A0ABY9JUJ3_9BACI|nr:PspA/IM30 family protein [Bacillus carboniphilus]WLR43047.1 PspA/IM30 family protein [Bacillus carboniphilus]
MFELFKRVKTVVNAELHSMLEKAEDPVLMIDQYLREMNKELLDAEKNTSKMIAEEKLLARKKTDLTSQIAKREMQALEALKNEREDLAKRALEDKKRLNEEVEQMKSLHHSTSLQVEDLKDRLKVMKNDYRQMELKRDSLKARAKAASTKKTINEAFRTSDEQSPQSGFGRMEEKVIRMEAEAHASEEMGMVNRTLDQELDSITTDQEINDELEQLKKKLINEKE